MSVQTVWRWEPGLDGLDGVPEVRGESRLVAAEGDEGPALPVPAGKADVAAVQEPRSTVPSASEMGSQLT
jgi:hypothetical protein